MCRSIRLSMVATSRLWSCASSPGPRYLRSNTISRRQCTWLVPRWVYALDAQVCWWLGNPSAATNWQAAKQLQTLIFPRGVEQTKRSWPVSERKTALKHIQWAVKSGCGGFLSVSFGLPRVLVSLVDFNLTNSYANSLRRTWLCR